MTAQAIKKKGEITIWALLILILTTDIPQMIL
jgi:hypothetical protein